MSNPHDPTFGGRIQDPAGQPTRVTIYPVILSYPHVFSPKKSQNDDQEDMYQTEIWIPMDDPSFPLNMGSLDAAQKAAAFAKWQNKIPNFTHPPFRDLESKNEPPEMKGYFLNCKSKTKPGVSYNAAPPGATPQLMPVTDQNMVYAGVICAVALNAYAYDKKGGKGVAYALNNIVLLKDGIRMGGGPRAVEEDFSHNLTALPFGQVGGYSATAAAATAPPQPGLQQSWQQPSAGYGVPPQQPAAPAWGGQPQQQAPQQMAWGAPSPAQMPPQPGWGAPPQ